MCHAAALWPVAASLVAGYALVTFLARWDAWRETNRRRDLMSEWLARYEQAQHTWRESPVVDLERRG